MELSAASPLGKVLRFPLRLLPPQSVLPIMQGRLRGKRWVVGSSNHGCWLGTYEVEKRRVFEAIVEENGVVFDIGAHVGFYTLLASVLVGQGGKVVAFEPLPGNLDFLKRHLRLNHVNNVTIVDAAVCHRSAAAYFEEGSTSSTGRIAPTGALQVRTVALDDLVSNGKLPVPDYIKIDVEGTEMLALSGAKSILERFHPTLFLAVHTKEINRQCCRFLRALDYQLTAIDGAAVEDCDELLAWLSPRLRESVERKLISGAPRRRLARGML